jgi:hypothetical protein
MPTIPTINRGAEIVPKWFSVVIGLVLCWLAYGFDKQIHAGDLADNAANWVQVYALAGAGLFFVFASHAVDRFKSAGLAAVGWVRQQADTTTPIEDFMALRRLAAKYPALAANLEPIIVELMKEGQAIPSA